MQSMKSFVTDFLISKHTYCQNSQTAGGIILPESTVSKANEGEVISVGSGMQTKDGIHIGVSVSVGDKVLLPEYGGLMIKMDGEDVYLFRNDEILAKFVDEPKK